jgi:hypothetical protein
MQEQLVFIAGNRRTLIITCAAGTENYAAAQSAFTHILNSFQVDYSWWDTLSPIAQSGIIASLVVMALATLVGGPLILMKWRYSN